MHAGKASFIRKDLGGCLMHACKSGIRKWEKETVAARKIHISQLSLCLNPVQALPEGGCRERSCCTCIVMMESGLKSWRVVYPYPFLFYKQQGSGEVIPKGNVASYHLSVLCLWEPKYSTVGRKQCSLWWLWEQWLGTDSSNNEVL